MSTEENKKDMIQEGLRNAVSSIFTMMIGGEPVFKGAKEIDGFSLTGDVAGLMYLPCERSGLIACVVSEKLARTLVARMTGTDEGDLVSDDIADGIGEMVNMLAGSFKTQHPESGITLTPPLSLIGPGCSLTWKVDHPSTILEYEVEGCPFTVAVSL